MSDTTRSDTPQRTEPHWFHAAAELRSALADVFPDITFQVTRDPHILAIDVWWEDGPTEVQVKPIARSFELGGEGGYVMVERVVSEDFKALLIDDFELYLGESYDPKGHYHAGVNEQGEVVRCDGSWIHGAAILWLMSQATSVDGERFVSRSAS